MAPSRVTVSVLYFIYLKMYCIQNIHGITCITRPFHYYATLFGQFYPHFPLSSCHYVSHWPEPLVTSGVARAPQTPRPWGAREVEGARQRAARKK